MKRLITTISILLAVLGNNANISADIKDDTNALKAAIYAQDPFALKVLLVKGAAIDEEILDEAVKSRNKKIMEIIDSYWDQNKRQTMMTHESEAWKLYSEGRTLTKLKEPDFQKAKGLFERVVEMMSAHEVFPHYDDPYFILGISYERLKEHRAAIKAYANAATRDPSHVPALIGAGNISLWLKDYEQAADYYQKILNVSPENSEAAYGLAYAYSSIKGKCDQAQQIFRHDLGDRMLYPDAKQLRSFIDRGCPQHELWENRN